MWVGYYANNLMHMGNRTSNRVEGTHAAIKFHNGTSTGRMSVVTNKIMAWVKERVSSYKSTANKLKKDYSNIVNKKRKTTGTYNPSRSLTLKNQFC